MAENVEITAESASPLEKDFVLKKIKEYENFVKLKLEPKIQDLEKSKAVIQDEIDEYAKFTCISKEIAELEPHMEYKSLVDVGQGCYVKTVVANPKQSVYLNIGLGFFSELAWPHAMEVVKEREIILQKKIINVQAAIDQVQSDMKEAVEANSQLKKLTSSL